MTRNIVHVVWTVVLHLWLLVLVATVLFAPLGGGNTTSDTPFSGALSSVVLALAVTALSFMAAWVFLTGRARSFAMMTYRIR